MEIKTANKLAKLFTFFIPVKLLRRHIRSKIISHLIPGCLCNDIDDIIETEFKSSGKKKLAYISDNILLSRWEKFFLWGGREICD